MKRNIITTGDGSKTIQIEDWNEQYHSKHGAIQEAYHVFIKNGLHFCSKMLNTENNTTIALLEIGFGTGLNAFITWLETERLNSNIDYVGVEAYPILTEEVTQLNYPEQLQENQIKFDILHSISWEEKHRLDKGFSITKQNCFFSEIAETNKYNLIYFDAFGARVQPELWTETIFEKMYNALQDKGVLVTYSAKGSVRRAMQSVGFFVEKLPGPPGKREMLRAVKMT
ncbi:MAG: tRNA (5-methylaminomethyl-2-thiouridine)(34)-methyltransferase MnmD [Aestuariibaculum sp.]